MEGSGADVSISAGCHLRATAAGLRLKWGSSHSRVRLSSRQNRGQAVHSAWGILKRSDIELPCDPAGLLLGVEPKGLKTGMCTDICTPAYPDIQIYSREPKGGDTQVCIVRCLGT